MKKRILIILISILCCFVIFTATACESSDGLEDIPLFSNGLLGEKETADVANGSFIYEGFKKSILTAISTKPGVYPSETMQITVYTTCSYNLVEYAGNVVFLDKNGDTLESSNCSKTREISAYNVIENTFNVKVNTYNKIDSVKISFIGKTYDKKYTPRNSSERTSYNVFFKLNENLVFDYKTVVKNSAVSAPVKSPVETGSVFSHWYLYSEGSKYNFSNSVNSDLALYAYFKNNYTVKFMVDNSLYSTKTVSSGECVSKPSNPTKENYIFVGWYTDSDFKNEYDFSVGVTSNKSLYAGFKIDAATLTNKITTSAMRSMVTVECKSYNSFLGITTSSETHLGSGVIFAKTSNYYYLLTNCHVAHKREGYDKQKFTIIDYQGNEYEGRLYSKNGTDSISASYDLACIYFKITNDNLQKISFGNTVEEGDDVISIGSPKSQSNAITFGNIIDNRKITTSGEKYLSNVTFEVHKHSALVASGSSGGALLDSNLRLVGINYAGKAGDGFSYGYAIPIEKVKEFLNKYVYD